MYEIQVSYTSMLTMHPMAQISMAYVNPDWRMTSGALSENALNILTVGVEPAL